MDQNTIESLRRLAERPGTEHEGAVAREMLRRLEAKIPAENRGLIPSLRELLKRHGIPDAWTCPCGAVNSVGDGPCAETWKHLDIQTQIRAKFAKGDRVYYNCWAYPRNCPGRFAAYVKLKPEIGDYPWAWISVKFDHLKQARQIPIISARGWLLSHEPLEAAAADVLSAA